MVRGVRTTHASSDVAAYLARTMRLRLLHTPPLDGATNMALDEALLTRAQRAGEVTVRVYTWARPTLSFGRHQTARGVYDPDRAAAHGIDVVRRPTGGRAVLHARELTYSVTAPTRRLGEPHASLPATHARITAVIGAALAELGADVTAATPAGRARRPDASPCFDTPAEGELITRHDARKLVGSAQWREDGAFLQHGSILIADDQARIADCRVDQIATTTSSSARPATLAQVLGRTPHPDEVASAVLDAARRYRAELGAEPGLEPGGAPGTDDNSCEDSVAVDYRDDPALAAEVARLLPRYLDPGWTWRR